ncbi:MAG TPA: 30S ribosomal protein S20 [Candidatus Marinimicrobia bacterium]|nr:30S ribosomal protein S20 [Candidatus Neomarinimicrobiota bacterium]MDP6142564.1 30S ribosomal protein S20 [Candidatus Neomarinimicrobiota bacterium]MDP6261840.1 30S ribosomal protein S20 [Candidatus Neomarinimicrobiota bacterium]MDP7127964.1 30S ribosomal protein S20 [Candidatus Neomarinimicrobiota bacterium]MDP7337201.1 30S ribosomal protein S20 [Candidatus Neomarinimicrobiota bacterium]
MDRHPQQIKRERQDITRRNRNIRNMSKLRTLINNVLQTNDPVEADSVYKNAVSFIDKMVSKRLIHKNTAARRKTQITRHVNSIRKD